MGEISDMIIEGELCNVCGGYIGDSCGFPRSCSDCKKESKKNKKKGNQNVKS